MNVALFEFHCAINNDKTNLAICVLACLTEENRVVKENAGQVILRESSKELGKNERHPDPHSKLGRGGNAPQGCLQTANKP